MAHIQLISVAEIASPDGKIWKFPYAFPVILRGLMASKHTFDLIDTHMHKISYEDLFEFVKGCKAKIYGISGWSHNYLLVKHLVALIREYHPDSVIIVGGIISGNFRALMENTDVDIVSSATEGESVLPEILDTLDDSSRSLEDVDGITYRDKSTEEIVVTATRKFMSREEFSNWSGQPIPVYEYFDKELKEMAQNINSMTDVPVKGFPIVTMRGCPFQCTFCGFFTGQTFLRLSWPSFFNEVEFLMDRYGIQDIYSYDTNMMLKEKDVDEFCDMYHARGHTFKSLIELRPTFGDVEMFRKLKNANVDVISFGIEHGSQEMLDRMKKAYKMDVMLDLYPDAYEAGLITYGNFIFGTPGETPKTVRECRHLMMTFEKLVRKQKKDFKAMGKFSTSGYGWTILIPSPPSELYEKAIAEGYIENEDAYLESLSDEKNAQLLKGSLQKITLGHTGGDVNMSEFSSRSALKAYVSYNNSYVKLQASLLEKKDLILNANHVVTHLASTVSNYAKYRCFLILDRLPFNFNRGRSQLGPAGTTIGSDWPKYNSARNDWPSVWRDAYTREDRNRGTVRLPVIGEGTSDSSLVKPVASGVTND